MVLVGIIFDASGDSDLSNAVTAGAFVHRIFTWLVPILVGLIPLGAWQRDMVKQREAVGGD